MCCIHNLHERLSIIFIQSINLLVFPLPPVSYPPALISCCRFRLSAGSCLSFCLVLRRKITAECLELWGWRRCARWPVFKMHARPPQLGRASPLSVVEIRQAGRQAGIPMLGEPPVFIYSPLLSLSHTPRSLCLSLQKQWHWGTTPFPVVPTNDQLQRHEAALLPPPSHSSPFFFFSLVPVFLIITPRLKHDVSHC